MAFTPQVSEKDSFWEIIYLPHFYFEKKYVRWLTYYSVIYAICYITLALYSMAANPEKVVELDVIITVLCLECILAQISLCDEEKDLREIISIRTLHFWSDDFLPESLKKRNERDIKFFIYAHWVVWLLIPLLFVVQFFTFSLSKFLYGESWAPFWKHAARVAFYVFGYSGFYVGNSHECYYAYVILHGYFQMKVLLIYLREEFAKLKTKVNSEEYQINTEDILLRCIEHHQILTIYGTKTTVLYRRWIIWHVLLSLIVCTLGLHYLLYNPQCSYTLMLVGTAQVVLLSLLYITTAQLLHDVYSDFHSELLTVEWYTFNRNNQRLYYMFLMFTQKDFGIELLPSVVLTRPFITRFINTVYGGVTLLRSIQK